MGAYHQLWQIEKSFRMSKTDLRGPADLPPQTRLNRSASDHRDGRPRGQPLARTPDRPVDQEARPDPTALPQHRRPDRQPHPARRHTPRRPSPSDHHRCQERHRWTLMKPNAGPGPPGTTSPRRDTYLDGGRRRLALPVVATDTCRTASVPGGPAPRPRPGRGPGQSDQADRHGPLPVPRVRHQPGLAATRR